MTDEQHVLLDAINGAVDQMTQLNSYLFSRNMKATDQVIYGHSGHTVNFQANVLCGVLAQFDGEGNLELAEGNLSSGSTIESSSNGPRALSIKSELIVANNHLYQRFNILNPVISEN